MWTRTLLVVLAAGLVAACGARSELSVGTGSSTGEARDCGAPWVVFTLIQDADSTSHLYARRADGSDGHLVTLSQDEASYPSTTPDGTALLYAGPELQHLYLHHFADGTDTVLDTLSQVGFGSLSPDGTLVAFGDGNDLWIVGLSGSPAQQLLISGQATPTGAAGYPVFTADSQTVIFAVGGLVQSIHPDGSALTTLISDSSIDTFPNPALSPDAQQLVAVVSCDGTAFEMRTWPVSSLPAPCTTGTVVTTVPGGTPYYDQAWGPTGLIAYSGGHDVFLVSATGGTPTNLTADITGTTASASEPTWVPACVALP
jgi:hypothetical protein